MADKIIQNKKTNIFLNKNFTLLFSSKIVSQLGDQIYAFALSWFILDLTKSSFQMSVFLVIDTLVIALISPFGGVIADRVNRKKIMIIMDIIRGLIVIFMAILLSLHMIQIWMLYISAVLLGFCGSIFSPSASAIIPDVVSDDELNQATSLNQMTWNFCALLGMVISGILYNSIGITGIFIINAISFLISGILTVQIKLPVYIKKITEKINNMKNEIERVIIDLYQGFEYIKNNKLIFNLIISNMIYNLIIFPLGYVYFPYLFNVVLKATSFQLSLSIGTIFLGMTIASFVFPVLKEKFRLTIRSSFFWSLLILSIFNLLIIPVVFSPIKTYLSNWEITIYISITSLIIGFMTMHFFIPINIIFQRYTSDEFRGRFWGINSSFNSFSLPVALLVGGIAAQNIYMPFIFGISALMFFALNLWITNLKEIKELKE